MSGKLLATSGTLDGIGKLIAEFYCGSPKTLTETEPGTWSIHNADGKRLGRVSVVARVRRGLTRYCFECDPL